MSPVRLACAGDAETFVASSSGTWIALPAAEFEALSTLLYECGVLIDFRSWSHGDLIARINAAVISMNLDK